MSSKEITLGNFYFDKSNSEIGAGNFGTVYFGKDKRTDSDICVKVFSKKKQEFGQNVLQTICQKELDLTKSMIIDKHQNLVKIIDVFDDESLEDAYIIMELCDCNLTEYCQKNTFSQSDMIDFIYQVTNGYNHLEERNIAHRDMKPDNILIKSTKGKPLFKVLIFNIQIGDFGLGKCIEAAGSDLKTKNIGTPYYFAPEIANAQKVYSSKCDIFSFGIIIFEMLVGKQIFKTSLNREKLKEQNFESLFSAKLTGVDEWIKRLLNSMIVYDQQKRIGWKDLKVIIELNMIDKYKGITGRIFEENLFLGQFKSEKQKITVKILEKEDDQGIKKEFLFNQPYNPVDNNNVIKISDVINKDDESLVLVVMEGCDSNLFTLMQTFTSDKILNFIEQIVNGWYAIQLTQNKVFSISLQNILITQNENQKTYKITHYEFYQAKDKSKNQWIVHPVATIQELAWVVYQLILKEKVKFQDFQQDIRKQEKKNAIFQSLDPNTKSIVQSIMVPEQSWKGIYDLIQALKNDQKPKPQASVVAGVRYGTIQQQPQPQQQQQQPQFMPQNAFPIQQNKGQFPQQQNQQINIPNKIQFNQNVPAPPQQQPQQAIFQPQQMQPNVALNKNFIQPPQPGFIPQNNILVFPPQNQQQLNQNNFANLNFQNNNPIKFGTNKPQQQQFTTTNQQPQQQFQPSFNQNRATLNQNNNQQYPPQQQPQNQMFQNFNNNFNQPPKK